MKAKLCPILAIGFDAPKDKKNPDPRVCNQDCAWYNEEEDCCNVTSIDMKLTELIDYTCASTMAMPYEEYGDL